MPRELLPITAAASQEKVVRPLILAEMEFETGTVRVTDVPFNISWNRENFTGVGQLGGISAVEEGAELQSYAINLSLSGIPSELVSLALLDAYQGKDVRIYLALLDTEHRLIGDPMLLFRGRMDTMDIELGETATITLTVQSRMADWERPRLRRYTDEDQRSKYPSDKGLEYVSQMAEKTIYWGRESTSS